MFLLAEFAGIIANKAASIALTQWKLQATAIHFLYEKGIGLTSPRYKRKKLLG